MPHRDDRIPLRQIAAVRALQRIVAETEAARAASALREKDEALQESERQHQAIRENWLAALHAPPLRIETLPLWSGAVQRQTAVVRQAGTERDAATAELERRAQGLHAATTHSDQADGNARRAMKDALRRRDEAALHDASEMHLQRRSGP